MSGKSEKVRCHICGDEFHARGIGMHIKSHNMPDAYPGWQRDVAILGGDPTP